MTRTTKTRKAPAYKLEKYQGKNKRWYWRLKAPNGNIVADCAQGAGYSTKQGLSKGIDSVRRAFSTKGKIDEVEV